MSTRASTAAGRRRPATRSGSRRRKVSRGQALRRRVGWLLGIVAASALAFALVHPMFDKAVQELSLPLRHEDIIRQQAADKGLDPSLIAAVIYVESHFRDQTSQAGAKGLMQLLPSTADYIAHLSGGTNFNHGDLATPQINIAYGSYYLSYLLRHYHGSEVLALAAYNAGERNVDGWLAGAAARGEQFDVATHIPFAETRLYVQKVLAARRQYRRQYAHQLGL